MLIWLCTSTGIPPLCWHVPLAVSCTMLTLLCASVLPASPASAYCRLSDMLLVAAVAGVDTMNMGSLRNELLMPHMHQHLAARGILEEEEDDLDQEMMILGNTPNFGAGGSFLKASPTVLGSMPPPAPRPRPGPSGSGNSFINSILSNGPLHHQNGAPTGPGQQQPAPGTSSAAAVPQQRHQPHQHRLLFDEDETSEETSDDDDDMMGMSPEIPSIIMAAAAARPAATSLVPPNVFRNAFRLHGQGPGINPWAAPVDLHATR